MSLSADSLHKKLDQLTVQCNMLQADNQKLRSENERSNQMNSLLKNKASTATDECKRAQNKLLQALREISLLRKDRDIGEEEVCELMEERAEQDRAQLKVLHLVEDANLKIYSRDVQLGEVSHELQLASSRLAQSECIRQQQISKLQAQVDQQSQQLSDGNSEREEQRALLHQRTAEFQDSQTTQYHVAKELDRAHSTRVHCEAAVSALTTNANQMRGDQHKLISDLDRMFNTSNSSRSLSKAVRQVQL